eukprot:m.192725 g.192725  ORF g.192725 m.192725 type:complete len:1196 (-) comp32480_c0_seq1:201-3788(-)
MARMYSYWLTLLVAVIENASLILSLTTTPTLIDHGITSMDVPIWLDGGDWTATNTGGSRLHRDLIHSNPSIQAQVPGDIITDLQRVGKVGDPYWNVTWRDPKFIQAWNDGVWTYSRTFPTTSAMMTSSKTLLVFDGIRMGAMIQLNSNFLGNATDQFLRYEFEVRHFLNNATNGTNTVTVSFHKDIATGGRFTYSSQIDWAPVFATTDPTSSGTDAQRIVGRETFGFGIWKSVYVVPVKSVAITQFEPHTFYAGGHPVSILSDSNHAGFDIQARVTLWAATDLISGNLSVSVQGLSSATSYSPITLTAGSNNITLRIPANTTQHAQLWHPRGNGNQVRYNITVTFVSASNTLDIVESWRLVGFRHVALVTVNDTDPIIAKAAKDQDGTGQLGMFFRVNGAVIYARGGNKVPMDLLDGRMSAYAHRRLVQSAAEGNMNMLRVWGGGIWEPRAFFDACDELGVMVYLDMQFTWTQVTVLGGASETVRLELTYQLQRLSHHPSIVLLDGCNECGGGGLYESFVMPTVASVDQSRPIWPSCPSGGWSGGVDRLTARPNGNTLVVGQTSPRTPFPFPLEGHGPYIGLGSGAGHLGEGHPYVGPCDGVTVPSAVPQLTGPAHESWYKSEFGCVAWSSFESISAQLPQDQWSLHSDSSYFRNWPVDTVITGFFGPQELNKTGEFAFKKQLYQSMLGQALFLKTEIETWRSTNNFGTTIWMYNEIWPTGGWGSIEYGGNTTGQISGGRWKPLQYFFRSSTFSDQLSTCNTAGACFVTNDSPFTFNGTVTIVLVNTMTSKSTTLGQHSVNLAAGAGITQWFCPSTSITLTSSLNTSGVGTGSSYSETPGWIPSGAYYLQMQGDTSACENACDGNATCLGFTQAQGSGDYCWLYPTTIVLLESYTNGTWFQKVATQPLYRLHSDSLPFDRLNFTRVVTGDTLACETQCDADVKCLGFTEDPNNSPNMCWLYSDVTMLQYVSGDVWIQKPGTAPIPSPPPPPPTPSPPGPPPPLPCTPWASLAEWKLVGCDALGSNCLLTIQVTSENSVTRNDDVTNADRNKVDANAGGAVAKQVQSVVKSFNVLPFQPPKSIQIPSSTVITHIGFPLASSSSPSSSSSFSSSSPISSKSTNTTVVPITLSATNVTMYVTLTTIVPGRFSDNAFLLLPDASPMTIEFLPWEIVDDLSLLREELNKTLRVEHLATYL